MTLPTAAATRRDRLLHAATSLFGRWGFDKTSIDDIAREAGVSKGAFYLEFPSKDGVFKAVLQHEVRRHTQDWLKRFEADPGDWSFARLIQHSLAEIKENPFVLGIVTRDQQLLGSFLVRHPEFIAQSLAARTELFTKLQEVGAIRADLEPRVLAYLLSATCYGMLTGASLIPASGRVSFEEALQGLGLWLDQALAPGSTKARHAGKAVILEVLTKLRGAL